MGEPSFAIPVHPTRTYPYSGGLKYEGGTLFRVCPDEDHPTDELASLVETVLEAGPYRYGDFVSLPMPLYLVRDDETGDVFRVSVRDGAIRFHVLPETGAPGLQALYGRLTERTETDWCVERETE
jgi:hypothetical protein